MKSILVGSTYFFKGLEGFKSKDTDRVVLVDNPVGFKYMRQSSDGSKCTFEIARLPKEVLIEKALQTKTPMLLNRFLVPEFCNEIGFTVDDLEQLRPLCERMDEKHKYLNVIFDAYIKNKKFSLTKAQKEAAFKMYKDARKAEGEQK